MHLFHKWTKWTILRRDTFELWCGLVFYDLQQRHCEKCGKVQIESHETFPLLKAPNSK